MKKSSFVSAISLALLGLLARQAQASPYTVTITQQGSNVVAIGSGAIDLTGLGTAHSGGIDQPFLNPATGELETGSQGSAQVYFAFINGPTNFGAGGGTSASSLGNGGTFGFFAAPYSTYYADILVPADYVSDSPLSNSATWDSATFTTLGVTPGTYVWTWGTGTDQNFTIDVQTSSPSGNVSEPRTLGLLGAGLLGVGLACLRRRKTA